MGMGVCIRAFLLLALTGFGGVVVVLGSDDFAPPQKQPFVMPQRHRRVAIPEDVREKMTNTVLNTIGAGVTAFTCLVCNRQFSRGSDLT